MITVEKVHPSGAWHISSIFRGELVTRTYYGYTLREARADYRREILGLSHATH